ncbi:hypothetical protein SLS58_004861 [Diplodia intermedia]|uniref:Uncharacterized protein n=1 Tax=Diplodia intermedia TaxID=856260 RepID=A0ABR3TTB7_9PEZI
MLPADILKVVHEEKVPYDGARASKLLQMLPDEFVWAQYPGIASAARASGSRNRRRPQDQAAFDEAMGWATDFMAYSRSKPPGTDRFQADSPRDELLRQHLCLYRMYHHHRVGLRKLTSNHLEAEQILMVIRRERLPYRDDDIAEFRKYLPTLDDFRDLTRTSALKKESDAVMKAQRSAVRSQVLAARDWADSRLSPNAERTPWNEKLVRIYFYHRLWHHLGKSVSEIHAEQQPSDPPQAVARCIADAIKLFDMPPGDEESMAELRAMLADDDYLPDTADLLPPSSASTTGPESPEVMDGDARKHRAAAEGWAAKRLARAEATGEPLLEAFGGEDGRRHGTLTHYRLWDAYGCSVAAIRDEFFPGAFPMMQRKRFAAITEGILAVLDQTRPPLHDRRRRDLLEALPEEAQQRYWKLAGEIARKAESRVNDDGGRAEGQERAEQQKVKHRGQ